MKTKLFFIGLQLTVTIITSNKINAQHLFASQPFHIVQHKSNTSPLTNNRLNDISIEAQRAFVSLFGNADTVFWSRSNKNYCVDFKINGERNKVLMTSGGEIIYSIAYGKEKNLPQEIKNKIKWVYPGYNIRSAVKIDQDEQVIWVIQMDNPTTNITLCVEDDKIKEMDRFIKFQVSELQTADQVETNKTLSYIIHQLIRL